MKRNILNKLAVGVLALTIGLTACSQPAEEATATPAPVEEKAETAAATPAADESKPDTWIADRTVRCQAFVDDIGVSIPKDQLNTPIMKELKARTGMDMEFSYTSGNSDLEVMTTFIASGDLPDLITYYLDDSSRPEFPILLKASREGVFTDLAPLFPSTEVYSKYLEEGFLGVDAQERIMFRDEFNGGAYLSVLKVQREAEPVSNPVTDYIGGMYIKKSIAEAVGVDPKSVKTQDQLYDLLVKIKAGGFVDDNGNPVTPLGPKFWGGSPDAMGYVTGNYNFGVSGNFNMLDGKVLHEAETEYVIDQIKFYRKLLAEDLMHPEFFTMDSTRAQEVSNSNGSAIIGDVHNYEKAIEINEYLPIKLNLYNGEDFEIKSPKDSGGGWAIPSTTENPQEVVDLMDYIATYEGKLLTVYGIEGQHFDMVDGFPVPKPEMMELLKSDDKEATTATGLPLSSRGFIGLSTLGSTDTDFVKEFGEAYYGGRSSEAEYAYAQSMVTYADRDFKYVPGLPATSLLSDMPELATQLAPLLDKKAYNDMKVQAIYAETEEEAMQIVESFRAQLEQAGIKEFEAYLEKTNTETPGLINFY